MNPRLRMAGSMLSGRVMQWFSSRPPTFSFRNRNEKYEGRFWGAVNETGTSRQIVDHGCWPAASLGF
jgi:hypothetical protein